MTTFLVALGDTMGGKYELLESIVVSGGGIPFVGVRCLEQFGDMADTAPFPLSLPLLPAVFSGDPSFDLTARGLFIIK